MQLNTARCRSVVAAVAIALAAAVILSGCSQKEQDKISNVKPPRPGTPATGSDVSGIYRTFDQSVLQLRANGTYVLVSQSSGASSGQFTIADGQLEVQSKDCGADVGHYKVVVSGKQKAGSARLEITTQDDSCAARRTALSTGFWVYADS